MTLVTWTPPSQPTIHEAFKDGTFLWKLDGKWAYSWQGNLDMVASDLDWFPTKAAARMAWEINKPEKPEESNATYKASSRYDFGWTDSRAVFGSSGV